MTRRPSRPPRALATLILGVALSASCSEAAGPTPSRDECEAFRDHAIALRIAQLETRSTAPAVVAAHREQLRIAAGDQLIAGCERETGRAFHDCAMAATSATELDRCAERSVP